MDFPAAEDRAAACTALADTVHAQAQVRDYLVIDTPGHDSYLTRLAHTMADSLITPLNDSFVDLDVLATVDPTTLAVTGTSHYSQMVEDARSQRQLLDNVVFDWIVLRNRLSNLGSRNKRLVGEGLQDLAQRLNFRVVDGLAEEAIFREFYPRGLTALDDLNEKTLGTRPTLSHATARLEIDNLLAALRLSAGREQGTPRPGTATRPRRSASGSGVGQGRRRLCPKPARERGRRRGAGNWARDERRTPAGAMPAKVSDSDARDGHRRIGERRRGGEPVGRRDVEAHGVGDRARRAARRSRRSSAAGRRSRRTRRTIGRRRCAPWSRSARAAVRTSGARPRRRRWRRRSARRRRRRRRASGSSPRSAKARLTAGLKCAPDTGPNIRIRTTRMAPVGSVLHSSASATLPPASRCAMMPEPTTVASRNAVPSASATARRASDGISVGS